MNKAELNQEYRRAREEKEAADKLRLEKHIAIYNKLANGEGNELLEFAQKRISLWRENKTCSEYYIETWERALKDLSFFESEILKPASGHLLQNTPFRMK